MTAAIAAAVDKSYPGCEVLRGATIRVRPGTVHALVGENGAGKSTLVKIIAGIVTADGGTLALGERTVDVASWNRGAARLAGVGIVQQHGASAPTLSVVENAVLGTEGGPMLALDAPASELKKLGDKIGLPIDPRARAGSLSLGAAQRAEIVAALYHGAKLLILDEPTAVLAPVEVEGLLARLRALAAEGMSIVIVTHKLDEVRTVADDVTVLRAGETVATFSTVDAPLDVAAIARAMVGSDLPPGEKVPAPAADAKVALSLKGVSFGELADATLEVRAGEIVGVAGVDGNGQRELALAITGLARGSGTIMLGGRDVTAASPARRLGAGLAHIPEDRHRGGLILSATVADNLTLGRADITGRFRIDRARVAAAARAQIEQLDIRPPNADALVESLSGGNQQKVVVGRELSRPNLVAVVASQPTRGVDLGAVARIHERLRAAATAGAGVLVISADLDELLALCHRIVVLLRGKIAGERTTREELGALMTGAA
ncbi:MAG: ATP-binding cassette domain-containing protein [Deltaproteobacteria bacterium]|nr:ATP-binding cassette domain-containing protein [Deltaproteobacteria bacterium]